MVFFPIKLIGPFTLEKSTLDIPTKEGITLGTLISFVTILDQLVSIFLCHPSKHTTLFQRL